MKAYKLMILLLLLGIQTVASASSFDRPARADSLNDPVSLGLIPLKSKHFAIEVNINGKGPYKFMLDTGSSVSVISQKLASKLKLVKTKQVKYTRNDKKYNANLYNVPELSLGDVHLYDYDMLAYPEPSFISYMKKEFHEDIDGILGVGAFYHYLLTLDLPEQNIILHSGNLTADADTTTYKNQDKIPMVAVVFKDEKNTRKMSFVLDTGSNEEFTMPPGIHTLPFKKISSESIQTGSHYGEQNAIKVKIKADAFWEGKEFTEPSVVYNKGLYDSSVNFGLMGLEVMKNLKITLDQKKLLIKVE